jgi:hypothetical protein
MHYQNWFADRLESTNIGGILLATESPRQIGILFVVVQLSDIPSSMKIGYRHEIAGAS